VLYLGYDFFFAAMVVCGAGVGTRPTLFSTVKKAKPRQKSGGVLLVGLF